MDIDIIIDMIIDGDSFRTMASKLNVKLSTLHAFTSLPEHSARIRNALEISAQSYEEMAEQVLISAESDKNEIARARELAQHYRWKASKRNPRRYGDKIDVTSDGKELKNAVNVIVQDAKTASEVDKLMNSDNN